MAEKEGIGWGGCGRARGRGRTKVLGRCGEYADPKSSEERGGNFFCRHTRQGLPLMNTMKKQSQKPSPGWKLRAKLSNRWRKTCDVKHASYSVFPCP